jgi:hypothetical protein
MRSIGRMLLIGTTVGITAALFSVLLVPAGAGAATASGMCPYSVSSGPSQRCPYSGRALHEGEPKCPSPRADEKAGPADQDGLRCPVSGETRRPASRPVPPLPIRIDRT